MYTDTSTITFRNKIYVTLLKTSFSEKTKNNPLIKTAYVTMSGEAMMSEDFHLSHSLDEINSGEIGCLLGHTESLLSSKGICIQLLEL